MSGAIILSVIFAAVIGAATGFRRWWHESLLLSVLAIPFTVSVISMLRLEEPFSIGWVLLTFLWTFLCASLAWAAAAGIHHGLFRLYVRLTSRSKERPGAGAP